MKITGSLDHLPLTFLLDSGVAVSIVHLGALPSESRKKIVTAGLAAPIGANGSPLDMVGQITIPIIISNFTTEQVFVVTALTVDSLVGTGYLVPHGIIINYDHGCLVIKDNKIPFTLPNGVTTTSDLSTCDRIISVHDTTTIHGRAVQLLDVSLQQKHWVCLTFCWNQQLLVIHPNMF